MPIGVLNFNFELKVRYHPTPTNKTIMNLSKYIVLYLLVVSIVSCNDFFETQVELPTPEHTPILATSCFIDAGNSYISAKVNRTFDLFEVTTSEEEEQVQGATVEMYKDGNLLYTLTQNIDFSSDSYSYQNGTGVPLTEAGETYELRISHPDYADVKATQTQPHPIPLISGEVREIGNDSFQLEGQLKLIFDDPAGEKNYYEVFATRRTTVYCTNDEGERIDTNRINANIFFKSEDFDSANAESNYTYSSVVLKDDIFDGQRYTLNLGFYDRSYFDKEALFPDADIDPNDFFSFNSLEYERDSVIVYWRTVTEDYYRYTTSLRKNQEARYDPFAEPVSVFTNFDNGIGAFCMRSELIYEIE